MKSDSRVTLLSAMIKALAVLIKPAAPLSKWMEMRESDGADTNYGFHLCFRVKKHAIHSSDTTSSSDEERFERRKSKSMTRARNR